MSDARAAGTIYDLGYQHYDGPRRGRANAIRTLANFSFRSAFGLGRGERAKVLPMVLLALVYLPAVIQVAVGSASGQPSLINYGQQMRMATLLLAIFAAAQAPELVVVDRQYGLLPLYLSRALRPTDYALARLAAFTGAFLLLTMGPEVVLFVGKTFLSASPWRALADDWHTLGPIVGGTALSACFMASLGLALASSASRRAYGSAGVMAFFLLMPAASTIAAGVASHDLRRYMLLLNPFYIMTGFADWLFGLQTSGLLIARRGPRPFVRPPPEFAGQWFLWVMLAASAIAVAVVVWRYRKAAE